MEMQIASLLMSHHPMPSLLGFFESLFRIIECLHCCASSAAYVTSSSAFIAVLLRLLMSHHPVPLLLFFFGISESLTFKLNSSSEKTLTWEKDKLVLGVPECVGNLTPGITCDALPYRFRAPTAWPFPQRVLNT
ncbi:hypothetical protein AVEN_36590-1 [Araneus ventricosus]|uniref:Uncharacterized protein n=1 Tax=Araneus ventricosus TaxID=182803 RepID=A0A4Y2XBF1_ARAVE|nr:hypothetical protein AVEN_221979-1 [Araneus ventricosus]GBO38138.1 hypothetical protein AVEN_61067-1 [Araneus ventricosus]GBO38168.1 hypothetical protein AVEN_135749-1 [Araneus ventricosus]GBO46953.1 hypothetical protein AVEN_36590-1 [Araneus ventricosus]